MIWRMGVGRIMAAVVIAGVRTAVHPLPLEDSTQEARGAEAITIAITITIAIIAVDLEVAGLMMAVTTSMMIDGGIEEARTLGLLMM
jgi:hypothetical protein